MTERNSVVDNRDIGTTWLWIDEYESQAGYLEINPWTQAMICIENSHETEEAQAILMSRLIDIADDLGVVLNT